jgi:predicted amidohydrolase
MFRLAVGQVDAGLDPAARMDWLAQILPSLDADLLVLPELFATGYNVGDALKSRGEATDGVSAIAIGDLAQEFDIAIHYGYVEAADGVLFNSAQCISPAGQVLGRHRKLMIPPGFEAEYFATGSETQTFEYRGVRFGMLICYDVEFPEAARRVAAQGVDVILVPTALGADWGWVAQTMVPTRGFENGVYLAYANSAGVENGMAFLGESFVGSPDGEVLVRAGGAAQVIVAQIDPERVKKAQKRLPYLREFQRLAL